MAAVIEVQGVCKAFDIPSERRTTLRSHVFGLFRPRKVERLQVLDEVSFSVERGETLGIMGRNGAGKSTLLKVLCGIYRPDRGRVVLRAPLTPILELGLGWNPELDAVDNILLIGTAMGLTLAEARRAVEPVLAFAELERFANLEVKHFSSGMGARLSYAVAFHSVREVLVLDEVLAVGDAGFQQKCFERFRKLVRDGCTGVLVSHGPALVSSMCQRAVLLEQGRLQSFTSPADAVDAYLRVTREARPA